jgi:hypothetical protein
LEERLERAARCFAGKRGGRERVVLIVPQRFVAQGLVAILGFFVGAVIVVVFVVVQRFVAIAFREIDVGDLVFNDIRKL